MANIQHNNQPNLQLLEKVLNKRNKGTWVYIDSENQTHFISNFLFKCIYLLTNWIGLLRGHQKLAEVISNSYVELALKSDLIANNRLEKVNYTKQAAEILKKTTNLPKRISSRIDKEEQKKMAQKAIRVGLESLSLTQPQEDKYLETLKNIEQIALLDSSPFNQSTLLTNDMKTDLRNRVKQVVAFHPSLRRFQEFLEFPDLAEVNKAKEQHRGSSIAQGVNSSYEMKDRNGSTCAIFKPDNQTIEQENGHNWFDAMEIDPENISKREEAAYLLDRGFSGVPHTRRVTLKNVNLEGSGQKTASGSLQQWIPNAQTFSQCTKAQQNRIDKEEMHRIAIQDLRWLNTDRHSGNLLLDSNGTVVPIDHGFILPNKVSRLTFSWLNFSQIKMPLSEESKAFIRSLNPEEDARELERLGINQAAIERMKISTLLLQQGVDAGLSLNQIAHLYMAGHNPFHLYLSRTHHPFFEEVLVKNILLKGCDPHQQIQLLIERYLEASRAHLNNPEPFASFGWKQREELSAGVNHYHFSNFLNGRPQSIHVIKIDHDVQDRYELRVIDHNEMEEPVASINQKQTLANVANAIPNAVALINGGAFHTSENDYHWDLGRYNPGDPVGLLKVNGRTAMVNHSIPSQNPNLDFWGFIGVDQEGQVNIHPSNRNNCEEIKNRCVNALGAGPVLIESGEIINLSNKVKSIVRERGFFRRLFEGKKKGLAPGNISDHYKKPWSRTCFAKDADGSWYMVVADRDDDLKGSGLTCSELAAFLKRLGCTYAINLDGGTSTQMIAKGSQNNRMKAINRPEVPNKRIRSSLAVVRRN